MSKTVPESDQPEFESLIEKGLPRLNAFVARHLGKRLRARESSADIVQSVCREALEDRERFEYRGEAAFRRWLERRALHKIFRKGEFHDAQKRAVGREWRPGGSGDAELDQVARDSGTPSGELINQESVERIHAAIEELPEHYRLAITLHRLVGMSHAEIAKETSKTEGAIRNHLYRGLALLGVRLTEEPET